MPKGHKIDRAEVARHISEGRTIPQTAAAMGASYTGIYVVVRELGLTPTAGKRLIDRAALAERYRTSDLTVPALAREFGFSYSGVFAALHEEGVEIEQRRRYQVKFDHGEAKRLSDEGMSVSEIAARLGVTRRSVGIVLNGGYKAEVRCADCGTSIDAGSARCQRCASIAMLKRSEDGKLFCPACQQWKPEDAFYRSRRRAARGRSSTCKVCNNAARREYRRTHPEVEQAAVERQLARRRERSRA